MAVGDVRFFKADIAGFAPTTLNPTSAGWIQITSITDLGQSATRLVVVDNGLVRLIMDKNASGRFEAYGFNGTAWKLIANFPGATDFQLPTLTAVTRNTTRAFEAAFTANDRTPDAGRHRVLILQGIPALGIRLVGPSSSYSAIVFFDTAINQKTALVGSSPIVAADGYGAVSFTLGNATNEFAIVPQPTKGLDLLFTRSKDGAETPISFSGDGIIFANTFGTPEDGWLIFGFMPRVYGVGDGGGANVGNGASGQLREAEDNFTAGGGAILAAVSDANCSGGKYLDFATIAVGHKATWNIDFPAAGIYYVLVPAIADAGAPTIRINVSGAANVAAQALAAIGFSNASVHKTFGPFTVPASGNRIVELEVITVDVATAIGADYIAIFPYESTASTPANQIFPKNLAQSLLRIVTPT